MFNCFNLIGITSVLKHVNEKNKTKKFSIDLHDNYVVISTQNIHNTLYLTGLLHTTLSVSLLHLRKLNIDIY